jgi:hypothetical protein
MPPLDKGARTGPNQGGVAGSAQNVGSNVQGTVQEYEIVLDTKNDKPDQHDNQIETRLASLRNFGAVAFATLTLNNILLLWAIYEVHGALSLLAPLVLNLLFYGAMVLVACIYRKLFLIIYKPESKAKFQTLATKYRHIVLFSTWYLVLNTVSLYQALNTIIFKLNLSHCPIGVLESFPSLSQAGQALYVVLILSYLSILVSLSAVMIYSQHMELFYTKQFFLS